MSNQLGLGVDFGTSHTVALLRDGETTTPLIFDGTPLLPSAVYATGDGQLRVGRDALHSARIDPARFEPNPKRRVDDGAILLGETECDIVQVFAAVLERVRDECVRVTGDLPPTTTFTHPATWGSARRMVLEDAATAAGFPDVRMRAEPIAAATYFAAQADVNLPVGSAVVVFDFGGGTFDVSVVRRTAGGFEVLSVDGVDDLGGVDIDFRLVEHLGRQFSDAPEWSRLVQPVTPEDRRFHRTFVDDVRSAKEQLSRHTGAELLIPLLNRETHLTREELERVTGPLLERALRVTTAVIRASRLTSDRIAGVFLVGGASRMPLVATLLHRQIGIAPTAIDQPELVVAHGATLEPAQPTRASPPPQQRRAAAPAKAPAPSGATSHEHQRLRQSWQSEPASTSRTSSPPPPAPTAPAGTTPASRTRPLSRSRLSPSAARADWPPWTLRAAQVIIWGQVLTAIVGLTLTVDLTRWFVIMLILSLGGAIAVTVPRRERWQGWVALGTQYAVIGVSYMVIGSEKPQPAVPAILMALLTAAMGVAMSHLNAGWFARTPGQRLVWWLNVTKTLSGGHFVLLVMAGIFPLAELDHHNDRRADYAADLLPLYVGVTIGAAIVFWGLAAQPLSARGWRTALITQCLMVGTTIVGIGLADGPTIAAPLAAIMFLSLVIIPLIFAARRFYPDTLRLGGTIG